MKKHLYILSFLALVACGDMGNAEKKVSYTTKSTDIEKNNAEKESDNLSELNQIQKNEDYFKSSYYKEDDFDDECLHKAKANLVKIVNCTYERANRIQAEVIKKAKLLNKDNIYSSDWVNKKRVAIEEECTKNYQNRGQIGKLEIASCICDGIYALGRSMGNAGYTTKSTDIEKNNTEKEGDNLSKPSQIQKNEDFFKNSYYKSDDTDKKCIEEANGNLVDMKNCTYEQVSKIEAGILKKAKSINKENIYTSNWIAKKEKVIGERCMKEFKNQGQTGDLQVAGCLSNGMYELGRRIK
ncbi:MAG: hypothetical protein WDW20_03260 [Neisseriaceae bacterium]